ncbi:MAG: lamin tail domain-containing protein [Patescibacteria group bacterium]
MKPRRLSIYRQTHINVWHEPVQPICARGLFERAPMSWYWYPWGRIGAVPTLRVGTRVPQKQIGKPAKYHIFKSIGLYVLLAGILLPLYPVHTKANRVVINEIKVGGEKATDEFVELSNPTDSEVNLSGWRLSKKTASGSLANLLTEFPSVSIPPRGLLLIAHQDFINTASPDLRYSTQSSITPDNTVILYSDNGHTIVDLVGMGTAGEAEGRAAPSPDPGMSIERYLGVDTNDNATDFTVRTTPTPKGENAENSDQGTENNHQGSDATPTTFIMFSEVLPNPKGSDEEDEWIELVNLSDQEVDLTDWAVEDASGKHYTIKRDATVASVTIAPKGYFILPRKATSISLNNIGTETLTLLNRNEQTIISLTYTGTAEEGYSWARGTEGNFAWTTTPTPSASNVITPPPSDNTKSQNQDDTKSRSMDTLHYATPNSPTTDAPPFKIVINELLPNPLGDDTSGEWIELKNENEDEVSLTGCVLSDESGARYTFTTQSAPIPPRGFLLLPRTLTKIVLNNDGDTIFLTFQGYTITQTHYGKTEEGMSFARDEEGNYAWTTSPTPGKPNIFSLPAEIEEKPDKDEPSSNANSAALAPQNNEVPPNTNKEPKSTELAIKGIRKVEINKIRALPHNTTVNTEGTVIVPPGVFGRTTLYLNGIQIYSVAMPFPDCTTDDLIEVQGYVSMSGNETRITIPKTGWMKKIGKGEPPQPPLLTAATLSDEQEGSLIQVEGKLIEKKGTTLWLDDDTGEVRIVLRDTIGLHPENFILGERYTVKGVLSETNAGYRVLPRGSDDMIAHGAVQGASIEKENATQNSHGDTPLYYIVTALAVIAIAVGVGIKKWREHKGISIPQ